MKEPKCGICRFTSLIMFVSRAIFYQLSRNLVCYTCLLSRIQWILPQWPESTTQLAAGQFQSCQAGVPDEWALSACSMAPAKLPLHRDSHKHTHIWKIKQSKGALHWLKSTELIWETLLNLAQISSVVQKDYKWSFTTKQIWNEMTNKLAHHKRRRVGQRWLKIIYEHR